MIEDRELLDDFARHGSETAFRTLVGRYLGLVQAAAMRQVNNPALAEEISQAVFTLLARKASSLPPRTILAGWLFQTTRFVAARAIRSDARRQRREQEAMAMQELSRPDDAWRRIAPDLDEALAQLGDTERNAVLLRFFEDKDHKQVAGALGIGEEAAKKRVNRGLEKLRAFFSGRGFTISAATVAALLAANGAQAASPALVASVTSTALAGAGATAGAISTLARETLAAWRWAKVKFAGMVAGGVAVTGIGVALVLPAANGPSPSPAAPARKVQSALPIKFSNDAFAGKSDKRFTTGIDPGTKRTANSTPAGHIKSVGPPVGSDSPDYLRLRAMRAKHLDVTSDSPLRGKHVRLTVWIKTKDILNWGGLGFQVRNEEGRIFANDEMTDRPIKGTTDWRQYHVVADVPDEVCVIDFGCALYGTGELWTDDFQIDIAQANTPITDDQLWHKWSPNSPDYTVAPDETNPHDGHPSLCLAYSPEGNAPRGSWMWWGQCIRAPEKFTNHTVRMSVWIKSEEVSGRAGPNLRPKGPNFELLAKDSHAARRPIHGSSDWTEHVVTCFIPEETQCLDTGFSFAGSGKLWIDMQSLKYEIIDDNTAPIPIK